jgi:tRNA A-37 threonylcarbamoyl transferase component Bud32
VSTIDLSPGSIFAGQFRIVRPLAKGGMGAVYVVEQSGTGRERALKLMHPILIADEKSVERFEREARVGSLIDSDHVVEVVAAGVESKGPTPWLCMELLKGETLADRIEKRGLPPRDEVIEIMKQLGHAIVAAHKAGIIHRDLKPENIFLAESRREGAPFTLKVLDFGVATLTTELQGPKTTQGVGSPMWMAPEQTNTGKVVPQTDLWAIGLIAFYLLTGQSYWVAAGTAGSTITALLVEIMVEPLVSASERAGVVAPNVPLPPGFDAWLSRLLVRDPRGRFATAEETFATLHAVLRGESPRGSNPELFARKEAFQQTAPAPSVTTPLAAPAMPAMQPAMPMQPMQHAMPMQPPMQHAMHTPPTVIMAPKRRVWPWVFFAMFAFGGTCVAALAWHAMTTLGEAAQGLAANGGLQADGPDRLNIRNPSTGGRVLSITPQGIEVTLPEDAGVAPLMEPIVPNAEVDDEEEADDAEEEDEDAEEEDEEEDAPTLEAPRGPRMPRGRGRGRHVQPDSTDSGARNFRDLVIHRCLQDLRNDGLALPRTRYTFARDGRVEPRTTDVQQRFARCVVGTGVRANDYAFTLP